MSRPSPSALAPRWIRGCVCVGLALSGCRATEGEPTKPERVPSQAAPQESEQRPPLVTLEIQLVDEELRTGLAERLGPTPKMDTKGDVQALLAVRHHIAEGWHIYWINPGESGLRTDLQVDAQGVEAGPVLFPAPERFVAEGGQVTYGWEDEAVLFVPLRDAGPDARVQLRSRWLACAESCIPGESDESVALSELDTSDASILATMLARVPEPAGERLTATWRDDKLELRAAEGRLDQFVPFAGEAAIFDGLEEQGDTLVLRYRFPGAGELPEGQGVLRWSDQGQARWLELAVAWPTTPEDTP